MSADMYRIPEVGDFVIRGPDFKDRERSYLEDQTGDYCIPGKVIFVQPNAKEPKLAAELHVIFEFPCGRHEVNRFRYGRADLFPEPNKRGSTFTQEVVPVRPDEAADLASPLQKEYRKLSAKFSPGTRVRRDGENLATVISDMYCSPYGFNIEVSVDKLLDPKASKWRVANRYWMLDKSVEVDEQAERPVIKEPAEYAPGDIVAFSQEALDQYGEEGRLQYGWGCIGDLDFEIVENLRGMIKGFFTDKGKMSYVVMFDEQKNFMVASNEIELAEDQSKPADPAEGETEGDEPTTTSTTTLSSYDEDDTTEATMAQKTLSQTTGSKKHVAEIINHGEKLILPEKMSLDGAIDLLERRKKYLDEVTVFVETFDAFPYDGAHAFDAVLTKKYGWSPAEATPGMFGPNPPAMITIETDVNKKKQVPWGSFSIPGVDGLLTCQVEWKNNRLLFSVAAKIKRKDEETVRSLFEEMREYLKTNSIYRGKAIRIRFTDEDGDTIPMPEPKFLDTTDIDEKTLVYSTQVEHLVQTNLFTPIERVQDLLANGIPVKRGVLLGGTFGTGKTMAAKVASKKAVENGITYLYIPRASDLATAIEFAKQYQSPACVIFCEDIDRVMAGDRSVEMDDILNIIDGIDTKTCNIIVVLTTNDLHAINPAMLRPGRLDAVIQVTPPDAKAIERLIRTYGGETVLPDTDLSKVSAILDGSIPAVVAEVVKRAKLSQLALQSPGEKVNAISEAALIESAASMRDQLEILKQATEKPKETPDLVSSFKSVVREAVKEHQEG